MAGETTITVVGNLTDDPELRFTPSGAAVAKFRIASTPRTMDRQSGEWKDGEPLFLACNVWRDAAEHVAESLQRGARVIVQGRLRQRSYETREGEKRTVYELEVDEIGPSLRYATAKVQKMSRSGGGGGGGFGASGGGGGNRQPSNNSGGGGGNNFDDPWATAAPASTGGARSGGAGNNSSFDDEPPF
ncbi:single-stranded DNA-binding protein [Amorphoplanes digitatis]|uniref:Single-stranded DNA-binding protein n=1 Tax=Actinoplanes digitatis TaxID=1868 RepID=A0A7W7I6B7_9ACTN|nr:single-stranded DNA-binding protein [Actinoplanes digitatis]MBB4767305.1 single-strand DNA-binding protein [Actinoplanes digitatis]GID98268.1 single-stranded DNA-binding protein [Actinoplanes digitatis]